MQTTVRVTRDWSRVQALDSSADIDLLKSLESEITAGLTGTGQNATRHDHIKAAVEIMRNDFANSVQLSETKSALTGDPRAELQRLMDMYVDGNRS